MSADLFKIKENETWIASVAVLGNGRSVFQTKGHGFKHQLCRHCYYLFR